MGLPRIDRERLLKIGQPIFSIPFRGGAQTVREIGLIPMGGYSMIQNIRGNYPSFEKRKGYRKKHGDADSTNKVLSLYQFSKGKRTERHFFAQFSDGDILKATSLPPTVDATIFGSEVFSGGANQIPGSWGNINDLLLHSNGVDQHQIYAGTANYVKKFVKFDGSAAPPNIPSDGIDYTQEVTDGKTTTVAVLDSLDTYANHECLFICTTVPANRLTWTISKVNGASSVVTIRYRKSDNTWADASAKDGTASGGKTLATTGGAMTWTHPSDEIPFFMFGRSGFWYRLDFSLQLDSEVEVSAVTYGSTFQSIVNVWDGIPVYAIEARYYDDSASIYRLFGTDDIEIDSATSSDKVYFNSFDPLMGIYIDPGETPNTTGSTTINSVYVWTGAAWKSVGTVTDGTNGLANPGWVTWGRPPYDTSYYPEKSQFQTSQYYSHWYYFTVDQTLNDDVRISIETMPYLDIEEVGAVGYVNCVWKNRAIYNFGDQYGYISAKNEPLYLNGDDYGIIEAGDGRSNKWVCAKKFVNELMIWQEEKGNEGGCHTIFEGYSPETFGKLLLSSQVGSFNAKSAIVIDGVLTSTATEETIKTLAFFLSHYDIIASDGRTDTVISDDVQNYFDPKKSECIRRGYENEMWLAHDTTNNILIVGLVSGSTATTPNIFLILDLKDKTFSFDKYAKNFSCMTEVEAASGEAPILQYAGGVDDGTVYQLNYGKHDFHTAIDSYATMQLNEGGNELFLNRLTLRMKTQTSGELDLNVYKNNVFKFAKDLAMEATDTGDAIKKHTIPINIASNNIGLKFKNDNISGEMYLQDVAPDLYYWEGR